MMTIFYLGLLVGAIGCIVGVVWTVGSIVKSIRIGLQLLRNVQDEPRRHEQARRILAWNLIEPAITISNILLLALLGVEPVTRILEGNARFHTWQEYLLPWSLGYWPMIVLFAIIPVIAQFNADPQVRRASRTTAKLGSMRLVLAVLTYETYGGAIILSVPCLIWSIKKIQEANHHLVRGSQTTPMAAIVGGKEGMAVLPINQHIEAPTFKVLFPDK